MRQLLIAMCIVLTAGLGIGFACDEGPREEPSPSPAAVESAPFAGGQGAWVAAGCSTDFERAINRRECRLPYDLLLQDASITGRNFAVPVTRVGGFDD